MSDFDGFGKGWKKAEELASPVTLHVEDVVITSGNFGKQVVITNEEFKCSLNDGNPSINRLREAYGDDLQVWKGKDMTFKRETFTHKGDTKFVWGVYPAAGSDEPVSDEEVFGAGEVGDPPTPDFG